jgi:hypothetical protein
MIAEKVMGIVPRDVRVRGEVDTPLVRMWTTSAYWQDGQHDRYTLEMNSAPKRRYSTDIAAAWEVHIAMCDRPFSVRRRYYEAMQQHATFHTDLGHRHTAAWPDVLTVLRNRFPEVICLAALEAFGGASSEATNG